MAVWIHKKRRIFLQVDSGFICHVESACLTFASEGDTIFIRLDSKQTGLLLWKETLSPEQRPSAPPPTRPAETWETHGELSQTTINKGSLLLCSMCLFVLFICCQIVNIKLASSRTSVEVNLFWELITNNFTLFQLSALSSYRSIHFLLFLSRNRAVKILRLIILTVLPGRKISDPPHCTTVSSKPAALPPAVDGLIVQEKRSPRNLSQGRSSVLLKPRRVRVRGRMKCRVGGNTESSNF